MYISCLVTIAQALIIWDQMTVCKLSQDIIII